jgi:hypothetical protein
MAVRPLPIQISNSLTTSLRANGSRECAPDDRLREAIHFAAQRKTKKEWIASSLRLRSLSYRGRAAPRNDDQPHLRDLATQGARGLPINSCPFRNKGAGNAGRPMRPAVSCARWSRKRTRAYRSHRNHPAFPAQWFYGLYRALPGAPGLLATVAPEKLSLLGNLTPASGCQDHTILPYASGALVSRTLRVHRSPPRVCDDRERPFCGTGWRRI